MSKGKKRCYFCGCGLTNQNKTSTTIDKRGYRLCWTWVDCCHSCKSKKKDKNP